MLWKMADAILVTHIVTGALGLLLGSAAILGAVRTKVPGWTAATYHWLVLAVCITAVALALLDLSALWFFGPIAAGSYALALWAHLAEKRQPSGWRARYLRGLGGSYIALVTALLVVSVGSPAAWVLPSLCGVPLLHGAAHRIG